MNPMVSVVENPSITVMEAVQANVLVADIEGFLITE